MDIFIVRKRKGKDRIPKSDIFTYVVRRPLTSEEKEKIQKDLEQLHSSY